MAFYALQLCYSIKLELVLLLISFMFFFLSNSFHTSTGNPSSLSYNSAEIIQDFRPR